MRLTRSSALFVATVNLSSACGAKTGLDTPDVPIDVTDAARPVDPRTPPTQRICVDRTPEGGLFRVALQTNPHVTTADVLFVMDRTGSMAEEIANIRDGLRTIIVPGLIREIPDLHLGLVTYGEFPIYPFGEHADRPFALNRALGSQFTALQDAIGNVTALGGGDNAEALVEALYQSANGTGLAPFIPPSGGCPTIGIGYACFRPDAQPIIIVMTDAPMHNGPVTLPDNHPYDPAAFAPYAAPHTYEQMLAVLNASLRPRVMGINSGLAPLSGRADLEQLSRDTQTLGSNGAPLVFDIGPDGSGLSAQVVAAIGRLTAEVPLNVSAQAIDDGSGGAALVRAVVPLAASPMSQVDRIDTTTFYNTVPGTRLDFGLDLDPDLAAPTALEQDFTVRIRFLDNGRATLGAQDVTIVIPAQGAHCAE